MRLLLCGGGTAGHVNPAIAIAEEALRQDKTTKILFLMFIISSNYLPIADFILSRILLFSCLF